MGLHDAANVGEALLAHYATVRELTKQLVMAVEYDNSELLGELMEARARELQGAETLLGELERGRLPDALREQAISTLEELRQEDEALRALLSARAQEVPVQLAEVRRTRASLAAHGYHGPYQGGAPGRPEVIDRRG